MNEEAADLDNREEFRQAIFGFIPDLDGEDFNSLAPSLELSSFPAGTVISSEGESYSHLGFLLNGKLSVRKANDFSSRPILVAVLESGTIFGEHGLAGSSTNVTLSAMEDSRALLLDHDRARQIIHDNPVLGVKILSRCLKVSNRRLQGATARIVDIL